MLLPRAVKSEADGAEGVVAGKAGRTGRLLNRVGLL